ncbi:MAG: TetR/AcrR family transcriptional regulator [Ruminococcus sp.]|nr:TetR/AcrR family transcriptional regulator [Ruminococcus sp.]
MEEKKIDRRSLKTQRAIREGLAELLADKELRNITVQELADRVDIHRVTFYKHFMDIYDVYEQMEKDILDSIANIAVEHGDKTKAEFYPFIIDYIESNPKVFRMIFSPHNTGVIKAKLTERIESLCRWFWLEDWEGDPADKQFNYAVHYHVQGALAVISKWVQQGFDVPKEEIIDALIDLDEMVRDSVIPLK